MTSRVEHTDELKLNLGSGPRAVPGWQNLDKSINTMLSRFPLIKRLLRRLNLLKPQHMDLWDKDVIRHDIRDLPYRNESVRCVYSSHALEHLYYTEAMTVLHEAYRVLVPGGIIRLALPEVLTAASDLLEMERQGDAHGSRVFNAKLLSHPTDRPSTLRRLVHPWTGHTHYWQPTPALVHSMLVEAGFANVTACSFRQGKLPDLSIIESRADGMHIEAEKLSARTRIP